MRIGASELWLTGAAFIAAAVYTLVVSAGFRPLLAWLPTVAAFGLLFRCGVRRWGWVGLGLAGAGIVFGGPPLGAIAGAAATLAGAIPLVHYLQRGGFDPDFSRRRDVRRFVLATPIAMVVPATLALLGASVIWRVQRPDWLSFWLGWWFNDTVGVLLAGPALLGMRLRTIASWPSQGWLPWILVAASIGFCFAAVWLPFGQRAWLGPAGIVITIAAAVRMDLSFSGLLAVSMVTAVMIGDAQAFDVGKGDQLPTSLIFRVWAFGTVLAVLMLMIRALLTERGTAEQRLLEAKLRHRQEVLEATWQEQQRIGREMHDALGQELTGLALSIKSLQARARERAPELLADLDTIAAACRHAFASSRAITRGLLPLAEHGGDLRAALIHLAESVPENSGVVVSAAIDPEVQVPPAVADGLYRIAQEALNNALRHAAARRITLNLARDGDRLCLRVIDDGRGMPALPDTGVGPGLGVRTMQFRAEQAGGRLRYERVGGGGTCLVCELPL